MSIDLSRFHATFFAESRQGLDAVENDMLRIEQGGANKETMDAIFRVVHSLKGSAGSLGFSEIAGLAHEMESVLDKLRQGAFEATPACTDLLLRGIDRLRSWMQAAEGNQPMDAADGANIVRDLQIMMQQAPTSAKNVPSQGEVKSAGKQRYTVVFRPSRDFFHSGNDPARFIEELGRLGEFESRVNFAALPGIEQFDPATCYLAWRLTLTTDSTPDAIREVFDWVSNACELVVEPAHDRETLVVEKRAASTESRDRRKNSRRADFNLATLQVGTERIDDLVNLVGELVITHTMLRQSVQGFDFGHDAKAQSVFLQLERNVHELQERVLSVRMMPVNHVFGRFPRLVRDLGMELGKAIDLKISGEAAELDKSVIERLIDPLTHLVRNALDHGIETPADRLAAGKLAKGTIALHAEHRGGRFVITVADDGRGIDPAMVRKRAIDIGLVTAEEEFDDTRAYALVMRPGFSTAQRVSNVSGRGVGLDVVGQNVRELGGSLEIASRIGVGTTFTLQLPLTLAIVDGMIVQAGGETYILPIAFIRECLQILPGQVQSVVGQGFVINIRGQYVPILKLTDLCGTVEGAPVEQPVLVVLEAENRVLALRVDELLGQSQVVIKSLESNYRKVDYMAGASILGDGRVALILDVPAVVKRYAELDANASHSQRGVVVA